MRCAHRPPQPRHPRSRRRRQDHAHRTDPLRDGHHPQTRRGPLTEVDDTFFVDADFQSLRTSAQDPRVAAAVTNWRTCMAEKGFPYPDPNAAISDPRWDLDAETIPKAEIDTALADVRCKTTTHLVKTWHEVETEVQQTQLRRDHSRFAALSTTRDTRLATARKVLAR